MDKGIERGAAFLDAAATERPETVSRIVKAALNAAQTAQEDAQVDSADTARWKPHPGGENPPTGEYARSVNLIRASDITPEPITWLWNGWLAAGKFHILGGSPGTGKTTISMALAATVSTGGRWPDGTRSAVGNVVIWSGEDDPADTLVPRLDLSGADRKRIHFVCNVLEGNEKRSFDPAIDMEPLRRELVKIGGVKLLIVDPIVSAITGDSHKNAEVRRGLQPLVDLAAELDCALLGITHFSKGTGGRDPTERITGSLAFGALARIVLVAAKYQAEEDDGKVTRIFCRSKSNIGADDGGFEYDLRQDELKAYPGVFSSCVRWGREVQGAARELLAVADATGDDGEGGTLSDAKSYLLDLLADGPLHAKTIKVDANDAGYSWATIRRAQKELGIRSERLGEEGKKGGGKWAWKLPENCPVLRCSKSENHGSTPERLSTLIKPSDTKGYSHVLEAENDLDAQPLKSEHLNQNERLNREKSVIVEGEI